MRPIVLNQKMTNLLRNCATKIAGPENRLILGVTALATQPFIDYYNKNVDKETRKYSVCKTIAKIVVGTTMGVIVRSRAIKYSANLIRHIDITKKIPDALRNPETRKILQNTIGDILGLGICVFSNFLIDAPLTKTGTNILVSKFVKEDRK